MIPWPCYLNECVSPLWKLTDPCIEFWNDFSSSSEILSFSQFSNFSNELADVLRSVILKNYPGISEKSVIAIVWIPHLLTSVSVHAILKAKAIFYPVLPQSCQDSLKCFENHLIAVICLGNTEKLIENHPNFTRYCPELISQNSVFQRRDWTLLLRSTNACLSEVNYSRNLSAPNNIPAYVITTSGSFSNEKKIVCVAHSCLTANIKDLIDRFGSCISSVGPLKSVLLSSPLTFDPSIVQIYFALISHRRLIVPSSTVFVGPTNLTQLCLSAGIDWIQCTPSQFVMVDEKSRSKLLSIPGIHLVLGGEPFPLTLFANLRHVKASIHGIYGTTEVSSWATFYSLNSPSDNDESKDSCNCVPPVQGATPIGYPMFATNTKLLGTNSTTMFELCLSRELGGFSIIRLNSSSSIMEHEFEQAVQSLQYSQMWETGDLVQLGACGKCLWFIGRKDRMAKRFGYQICLERLEHVICSFKIPQLRIRQCRCQVLNRNNIDQLVLFADIRRRQVNKTRNPLVSYANWRRKFQYDVIRRLRKYFSPNPDPWLPSNFVISSHRLPISAHGKLIYKPLKIRTRSGHIKSEILRLLNDSTGKSYTFKLDSKATFPELGGTSISALIFVETLIHRFPKLGDSRSKLLKNILTKTFFKFVKITVKYLATGGNTISPKLNAHKKPVKTRINSTEFADGYLMGFERVDYLSSFTRGQLTRLNRPTIERLSITLKWSCVLGKCVDASPVIVSNANKSRTILIGSHSGLFTSLELSTGQYTWPQPALDLSGRIEASACAFATPLLSNPSIAVGTLNGKLYVLNGECGTIVNCYDTKGAVKSAPLFIPQDELLISGSHGRAVHAFDLRTPSSSQPVWSNNVDDSAIVAPISGFQFEEKTFKSLLVPTLGGTLGCFDLRNPTKALWIHHENMPIFCRSTSFLTRCSDSLTFRVSVDGTILGLSTLSGNVIWKSHPLSTIGNYSVFSDPIVKTDDHSLIITTNNGFIYALNIFDGQVNWILDCRLGLGPKDPSSLNTPYLFTTYSSNPESSLLAVTRADGMILVCSIPPNSSIPQLPNVICTYNLPNKCFSSPVLCPVDENDELDLVCGCRDDRVYCFNLSAMR